MTLVNSASATDKAWFCSTCGAADISASELAGGEAHCNVCGWNGKVEDLATFRFSHGMNSPDEVFRMFFLDVRKMLSAGFAQDIGQMLIKWGFLETPTPKNARAVQQRLARYIAAVAKGIVDSIVRTRAELEREQHRAD